MMLVNERGDVVRLGAPISTPGGEGAVYEVPSEPSLVAKLYHKPADSQRAAKLQHLCGAGNAGLLNIAAWPRWLLFASNDRRSVRGFLMPRIEGKEIHRLYGPRDRCLEFPAAAWDFLIHVARNCAAAFETLHENGVVMADVNEKNLLVTSNGLVRLIDCDSYQVRNGSCYFLCDVGVPLWTPPELQTGVRQHGYHGLERTTNHDRFGLAVLIFELLFMGHHPFAGVPDGHHQLEIHEAIQRHLFAFSPQAWQRGIKAPPHTLPLAALPERLIRLFERAFLPGSERLNARPTGREWAHELDVLHTARKTCNYDPGHTYWNGLASCPWCQIAAGGGPNFFISVAIQLGAPGPVGDVSVFWATIQRIAVGDLMRKSPGPSIQLPAVTPRWMPLNRPTEPRLTKPQAPSSPAPVPSPALPQPVFPAPPKEPAPTQVARLRLGRFERDARTSGAGALICSIACLACIGLELLPGAFIGGAGTVLFLLTWAMKSGTATKERRQRLEAEQRAREKKRRQAQEKYSRELDEHNATVRKMQEEHAKAVASAQAVLAREQLRLEAEYRSKLSAYSAQLSRFENAWATFEDDRQKWQIESSARAQAVEQTRREMNDTGERLRSTLERYQSKVRVFRVNLESAHQRFQKATADEATEMRALELKKREALFRQFLDSKLIRNHRIHGVGPVKAATLVAHGFESALDITPTMNVTGVGPVLLRSLLSWRSQCEAAFRYDPNTPLPQAEVQAVRLKYTQARQSALVELRGGAGALSALEAETRRAVDSLESRIPQLARAHAQALADHQAAS